MHQSKTKWPEAVIGEEGQSVLEQLLKVESELRRQGQELAVAWRRGRACYVLDSLESESPMRAAVLAALIQELLGRWDPLDGKWHVGFWRALVSRSEGRLTQEEMQELVGLYRRKFGSSPPRVGRTSKGGADADALEKLAEKIRSALDDGVPIPKVAGPPPTTHSPFLRPRRTSL